MAQPGVMIYFELRPRMKRLSLEEKGALFDAILTYGEEHREPEFEGVLGLAWDFVKPDLDRDSQRYELQVQQHRYGVYVREAKRSGETVMPFEHWSKAEMMGDELRYPTTTTTPTSTPTSTPTPTPTSTPTSTPTPKERESRGDKSPPRPRFSPPGVEEVRLYCQEKGYDMSPEQFMDYYTANGWMVGKNKMKDWKAAVRNWQRKEDIHGNQNGNKRSDGTLRGGRTGNEAAGAAPNWTVGTVL